MKLQIRTLKESDWETMQSWWKAWGWPEVTKELMPLEGLGGLMIEKDGVAIASGFLYLTNSKVAWTEWIVSDPEYRQEDRAEALAMLVSGLEEIAISAGYKIILSVGRNKGLLNIHKELGYTVDDSPSYEISKKIA
jgi:hypothetical protein